MIFIKETAKYNRMLKDLCRDDEKLLKKIRKRTRIFSKNPSVKVLRNHKLRGKMRGQYAFSITDSIRVVYKKLSKSTVRFLAIGTHTEVYPN